MPKGKMIKESELYKAFGDKCAKPRSLNQVERLPDEQVPLPKGMLVRISFPSSGRGYPVRGAQLN